MWKLGAQVLAALLVAWGSLGVLPHDGATWGLLLGRGLWLVVLCNAINFMDGLDGLAAGCTLLACVVTAILCLHVHAGVETWGTALVMAVAIAGFLPFNFPKARLFMGMWAASAVASCWVRWGCTWPTCRHWRMAGRSCRSCYRACWPMWGDAAAPHAAAPPAPAGAPGACLPDGPSQRHETLIHHRAGLGGHAMRHGAACALAGGVIGLPAAASGPLALQLAWGVMVIWRVRHTPGLRW